MPSMQKTLPRILSSQPRLTILRNAVDRSIRLSLILLIAWMGWGTIRTFSTLIRGVPLTRQQAESGDGLAPLAAPQTVLGELPPDGPWTFQDDNSAVSTQDLPDLATVGDRLTAFEQDLARTLARTELERLPALPLGERLGISRGSKPTSPLLRAVRWSDRPGCRVYRLDSPRARLRIATNGSMGQNERFVGAALAVDLGAPASGWRTWVVSPPVKDASEPGESVSRFLSPSLLPLPAGVQPLARRWSLDGRLWLEVVDCSDAADLPLLWQREGWTLEPSADRERYLCRRGDQAVMAWSPTVRGSSTGPRSAMWVITIAGVGHSGGPGRVSSRGGLPPSP